MGGVVSTANSPLFSVLAFDGVFDTAVLTWTCLWSSDREMHVVVYLSRVCNGPRTVLQSLPHSFVLLPFEGGEGAAEEGAGESSAASALA